MFSNTLFQKISTYPWAQFCAPHLMHQRKFYAAFFSDCGNPAKPRSRINPERSLFSLALGWAMGKNGSKAKHKYAN